MRRRWLDAQAARAIAVALSLLVVAVGLCVFDHHADGDHEHAVVVDLCLAVLGVALVMAPALTLVVLGSATGVPGPALVRIPLHVLEPPPKRLPAR